MKVKSQKEENRAKDFSPLPTTRHPSSLLVSPLSPIINYPLSIINYPFSPAHSQLSTLDSQLSALFLASEFRLPASIPYIFILVPTNPTICCTHSSMLLTPASTWMSGFSGASYGALMPVKLGICPALAFL